MGDPIDDEAQAWLDHTRVLLKASKSKKDAPKKQAKALTKDIQTLDALMKKLLVTSAARHARYVQKRHDVAATARNAALVLDKGSLEAADAAIKKLAAELEGEMKAHKAFLTGVTKFDEGYAKMEIEVAKTAGLRGARAEGTKVHAHLAAASQFMRNAADRRAEAVKDASDSALKDAVSMLALVKTKLEEAGKDSKGAEQETKSYLEAIKTWSTLAPKARTVLQQLRSMPGAEALADDLQRRLGQATGGIKNVDGVFIGHDQAVKTVGDLDTLLKKAEAASADFLAQSLPAVVLLERRKIEPDLAAYQKLVPAYLDKAVRDEAALLLEVGRRDINAATTGLAALQARLKKETADLQRDKTACEKAEAAFNTTLASLVQLKVPEDLYAGLQRAGEAALLSDAADRQWQAAAGRLTATTRSLAEIETRYKTLGQEWNRCKAELLGIRKEASALVSFPVVRLRANALRERVDEVLGLFVGGDLQAAIDGYKKATIGRPAQALAVARTELNKLAHAKGVPVGDGKGNPPDDAARVAFVKELNAAISTVRKKAEEALAALLGQIDGNTSLDPAQRRLLEAHVGAMVDTIESQWQQFHSTAGADVTALQNQALASTDALNKLVKDQGKLKPKELETTLRKLQTDDARAFEANMPKWIGEAIERLAAMGVDVAAERQALAALAGLDGDKARTAAVNLAGKVREKLDAQGQASAKARDDSRQSLAAKVDEPLKKLPVSKAYREELQKDSLDTRALIDTNDADLLAAANARLDKQAKLLGDIAAHPEQHEANKSRLESMGSRLRKMSDVLPDSFRMLQTRLTQLWVDLKHTDPLTLKQRIDEFETGDHGVVAKETAMAARKKAIKDDYEPLKKAIEAIWDKHTGRLGNTLTVGGAFFPKEFVNYKEARLKEASSLVATELPMAQVLAPLRALKAKLDTIDQASSDSAKKAAVQKLNAEEMVNQRLVRDMAAQFEREMKAFKDGLLEQAKAAVKADPDGDKDLAESLSSVASSAGKMVSPYLALLGTLPHQRRGEQPAPDMQKMKGDFERARAMLGEAEQSARRLIETPSTTNVTGPGKDGLARLQPKWRERCAAYDGALRAIAEAMRSAAADQADPVKASAAKAAQLVERLAGGFRPDAFASSFAGLMEPLPDKKKDKAGHEKVLKLHLARREDALRVMRQYRTELTENRLRRLLTDTAQNPFEAASLMAAAGALRVALKEIELQVLDSA
jgi:hypothetical protein